MTENNNDKSLGLMTSGIDWWVVLIYAALVIFGWVNIYAAVYNDDHRSIFDITQRYGMQLVWIAISFFAAISILLIEDKYYHILAYPFYFVGLATMVGVLIFGTEVNGAKAWIDIGRVRIQPVEFMKIVTALALAKFMSSYSFNIKSMRGLYYIGLIIITPILLILVQNDTGSALVFAAFIIMLYREGFGKILYVLIMLMAVLFLASFLVEPLPTLVTVLLSCLIIQAFVNKEWQYSLRYLALLTMMTILVSLILPVDDLNSSIYYSLLIAFVLSIPVVARYTFRSRLDNIWTFVAIFTGAVMFTFVTDYFFDNILQTHHQKRILDLLGIENDPQGWSYNVNQSKIAIGSGGWSGKGFLEGTQTRFSFVPEQSTDFIFCTVGEEWGFIGSALVVALFVILIIRLFRMGERQKEPFARVYCYSVASVIFMHFAINIAMTVGLFPVVGIPLPFLSYGGSSLLAFTILLFIAVRLDSSQPRESGRKLL